MFFYVGRSVFRAGYVCVCVVEARLQFTPIFAYSRTSRASYKINVNTESYCCCVRFYSKFLIIRTIILVFE